MPKIAGMVGIALVGIEGLRPIPEANNEDQQFPFELP
jgi:hypothetical protein